MPVDSRQRESMPDLRAQSTANSVRRNVPARTVPSYSDFVDECEMAMFRRSVRWVEIRAGSLGTNSNP